MLIKEADARINDFANGDVFSPKDIIRRRLAGLINKQNKEYRKDIALDKKNVLRQKNKNLR